MSVEVLRDLPKNSHERNAVARQLRQAREFDQKDVYTTSRSMRDYESVLDGLEFFLQYVQDLDSNPTVLDLGAGKGRAVMELRRQHGSRFTYLATTLSYPGKFFQSEDIRTIQTSSEMLTGISDDSISGVLACYSLAYSAEPEFAIRRIDQVMKAGGIIKAKFIDEYNSNDNFTLQSGIKRSQRFERELCSMGYDVAVEERTYRGEILVGIKPGGEVEESASSLLLLDQQRHSERLRTIW